MELTAIKEISRLTELAAPEKRIVAAPAEPKHVYYVLDAKNELVKTRAEDAPDAHAAADVDTLCRLARRWENAGPEVWYTRAGVVLINNAFRRDRATLPLTPSPQLARLAEWDRAGSFAADQAALVRLLRTLFAGCVPADLVTVVRQVKTSKRADVDSQIGQSKVSLSRSMVAEMSGTSAIPERVTFDVPVFAQAAVPVTKPVRVEFEPDPASERFTLVVLPGDVEAAYAAAEVVLADRIRAALGDADVPVYRGCP